MQSILAYLSTSVASLRLRPMINDLSIGPESTHFNELNQKTFIFIQEHAFEYVVCKISFISALIQLVLLHWGLVTQNTPVN